jgi:HAD superfamily hydrolase (TIGR01509 family)
MRRKLIIFDCDGVLIDSEVIACRMMAEALTLEGYPITTEDMVHRFAGLSGKTRAALVERELGRKLPADFEAIAQHSLRAAFQQELQATAGIAEALDALPMPVCVASSSGADRLRFALDLVGLHSRFAGNIFSADSVSHGKPAPDLFLFAAARMQVAPADCLVVEDSAAGVQAATAAGMAVLGFCGGAHCTPPHAARLLAEGAMAVISDMTVLPRLIA